MLFASNIGMEWKHKFHRTEEKGDKFCDLFSH